MARKGKKQRTPKANPQSRRQELLKKAGIAPTDELLRMPWGDFEAQMRDAGVDTSKPKRTPRSSGGTKTVTVVVPTNAKPPSPKDENKKPRTKPKPKGKKASSKPPPPPPKPAATPPPPPSPAAASKPAANPFAQIFGSGSEPKKKKQPKTFFGKKAPKGQMGAMVAQQRQSPHNLANTRKEFGNWLGRVGAAMRREVQATVADVNRIGRPRTRATLGQPSQSGPQMTNVRGASSPAPAPPRSGAAGPQMTNVRSGVSAGGRTAPKRQVAFSSQSRSMNRRMRPTTSAPYLGPRGSTPVTVEEYRGIARDYVGAVRRGPAGGGKASATQIEDLRPRRPRAPIVREIGSVKKPAFMVGAAYGWTTTPKVQMSAPPLPGTGGRVGTFGFLRDNRRQIMGGGNFRDRAPVVRDIRPPAARRPSGMAGTGPGAGSPPQPTTPTGRPKKTSYKPQTPARPVNIERGPSVTTTRPAAPPSSVPSSVYTAPTRSSDAVGRERKSPRVIFKSESGNYATLSGREVSIFGAGDRTPRLVTPVSPKGSKSRTRLPTKQIDFSGFARDLITDLEAPWNAEDLPRRAPTKRVTEIQKISGVDEPTARAHAEKSLIRSMKHKYPSPFLSRTSWLGGGAQNINLPSVIPASKHTTPGRAKVGLTKAMKSRGLLGLAGAALSGTGVGAAVEFFSNVDTASGAMSPKSKAEFRRYQAEQSRRKAASVGATQKFFPFPRPPKTRSK